METVLAFVILALVMAGMAIGVILNGKPIKGSCGGIGALGMGTSCEICGDDKNKCEKEQKKTEGQVSGAQYYNAGKR